MNSWDSLIGQSLATEVRACLGKAARTAHTENGLRFDPHELGDNSQTYGQTVSTNARFIAAGLAEAMNDSRVIVREPGQMWWLEITRDDGIVVNVFLYKAAPSDRSIIDFSLDNTEVKKELTVDNGRQMTFFDRNEDPENSFLRNVVAVHFGNPDDGFQKIEVGAPYLTEQGETAWQWFERLDFEESLSEQAATVDEANIAAFPRLRLIEGNSDDRQTARNVETNNDRSFDGLELRDESEDEGDSRAGGAEQ